MNSKIVWNDLRLILAIQQSGTLIAAGRYLNVSHATVFRHLSAIENRLNVKLFNRSRSGCTPTLAGEELAAAGQRIEAQVLQVERQVVGRDLQPSGTIRITTLDSLLAGVLNPVFLAFQADHHNINLEISLSNQLFSLSKHEADVAIRPTMTPTQTLSGHKIGNLVYAVYGRHQLVSENENNIDFRQFNWLGPDKAMIYPELEKWMAERELDARCRYRIDSVLGMHAATAQGLGLAVLPCYLGEPDQGLRRLSEPIASLATELWALTHPALRKTARIRALMNYLRKTVVIE